MSTDLKTRVKLEPKDFQAQLYAGLIDVHGRCLLPLTEIVWGQPQIVFVNISEDGEFIGLNLHDRKNDGEPLSGGMFNEGTIKAYLGDSVSVNAIW